MLDGRQAAPRGAPLLARAGRNSRAQKSWVCPTCAESATFPVCPQPCSPAPAETAVPKNRGSDPSVPRVQRFTCAESATFRPQPRPNPTARRAGVPARSGVPRNEPEAKLPAQAEQPLPQPPTVASASPSSTWKEWPQPQEETAFRLLIAKPAA